MRGSLDGLLVVAVEQAVAAPFCTSHLAEAEARLIELAPLTERQRPTCRPVASIGAHAPLHATKRKVS
jgi:crotonobetainyl-CoA:carnitine CoA-transferase CaiB-like acyl-CoA transferase